MKPHPIHLRAENLFHDGPLPAYARRLVYNDASTRKRDRGIDYASYDVERVHDHDFMELVLVLGGCGLHRTAGGTQPISAGDVFVFRPGAWHGYERCKRLDIYNCCFGPGLLQRELAWTLGDPRLGWLLWNGPLTTGMHGMASVYVARSTLRRCVDHLNRLRELTTDPAPDRPAAVVGTLLMVLDELAVYATPDARPRHAGVHRAVASVVRAMADQVSRPWNLDDLARFTNLDPAYLSRLFKTATGLPPLAYLASIRAERAAMLLLRTGHSIGQIATDVGWPDPIYFARRFRAHFGLTATDYRRQFLRP